MMASISPEKKVSRDIKTGCKFNFIKNMKQFFTTMFSNNEGTSYKRVLGTVGFISLVIFLFTSGEAHKAEAVSAVEYITIATVFGTVVEKFANNKNNSTQL